MQAGRTIRRLREARGFTQADLAHRAKIGRITLIRVEAGTQDPTLSTLGRIADALRVEVYDLLPRGGKQR